MVMVPVIWQNLPSLPQFPNALPALFGDTSNCGNCFIVRSSWVCRLEVAVRRGMDSLTGKLCCGQTAERTWPPFSVFYGVLTGAT